MYKILNRAIHVTAYCFDFPQIYCQGRSQLVFWQIVSKADSLQGAGWSWWHNLQTMRVVSTLAAVGNYPVHRWKKGNTLLLQGNKNYFSAVCFLFLVIKSQQHRVRGRRQKDACDCTVCFSFKSVESMYYVELPCCYLPTMRMSWHTTTSPL